MTTLPSIPSSADAARVDMSKATVAHDAGHIYINNITADDKNYNVTLEWSTPTQSFDLTSVSPIQ